MSTYPDDFTDRGYGEDLFSQLHKGIDRLPPVDITYRDRTNSPEDLLALVLSEGSPLFFEERLRWGYSTEGEYADTPIPGAVTSGVVDRVSLTVEEWQRLGEYLFAKTGDTLPGSPLRHDPEDYCRRIITNHYKQEN